MGGTFLPDQVRFCRASYRYRGEVGIILAKKFNIESVKMNHPSSANFILHTIYHEGSYFAHKVKTDINGTLKKIIFYLILNILLSCRGARHIEHSEFSQTKLYSGIIQLCPIEHSKHFIPHKINNGALYYINNRWFISPFHPGESTIFYTLGSTKAIHSLIFSVVQYPKPRFWLGPVSPHRYIPPIRNPDFWFVHSVDTVKLLEIKRDIYYTENDLEIKSFSFSFFDSNNTLVFQESNQKNGFSKENRDKAIKNQKEGFKLLIDNIEFMYPDGSIGIGSMDTLYFVENIGFVNKFEIPEK